MAIVNQATKEVQVKIVYYGTPLAGKTTNLVQLHNYAKTTHCNSGSLVSLASTSDRTLFFDFLPQEGPTIKGFKVKYQIYTVPGLVRYNTTRQLVLRGVDGIVFVADSQQGEMEHNVESFDNLVANLRSLKKDLADIPYVLQYNKSDLPEVTPVDYMEFKLNIHGLQPSFTAIASKGEGVIQTFDKLTSMVVRKLEASDFELF